MSKKFAHCVFIPYLCSHLSNICNKTYSMNKTGPSLFKYNPPQNPDDDNLDRYFRLEIRT